MLNEPIHRGLNEAVVANVVELRLNFLPVVRRHKRKLFVQPGQGVKDAFIQFLHHVGVQQQPARGANADLHEGALDLQSLDDFLSVIGANVGAADEVGGCKAFEAAEPGHGEGSLFGIAGPQALDPFEHF